jgi:hypothetical protein
MVAAFSSMAKFIFQPLSDLLHAITPNAQIVQGVSCTVWLHPPTTQAFHPTTAYGITKTVDQAISYRDNFEWMNGWDGGRSQGSRYHLHKSQCLNEIGECSARWIQERVNHCNDELTIHDKTL